MVSGYRLIQERDPHFPYFDLESSIKDDQIFWSKKQLAKLYSKNISSKFTVELDDLYIRMSIRI